MVEAQSVQQFVLDDAVMDATRPLQGHQLLFSSTAHCREAANEETKIVNLQQLWLLVICINQCVR